MTAPRDIIIGGTASATLTTTGPGADITLTADSESTPDGIGGVQIGTLGAIATSGSVTLTGSDLFITGGTLDSVEVASDGANIQVQGAGNIVIEDGANAPANAQTIINGVISGLDLIENVAPVQLGIRLLIPEGSRILELKDINQFLADFDAKKLSYNWKSAYPLADDLQTKVYEAIQLGVSEGSSRREIFEQVWILAHNACEQSAPLLPPQRAESNPVPTMSEPWYCCAEPTDEQVAGM